MGPVTTLTDAARNTAEQLESLKNATTTPTVRLGVTGLSRAGKTVFISALLHNLIHGGRLPLFEAHASGRIARAKLAPQPDDNVPSFDYRSHIKALTDHRVWPNSTRQISEIRLTLEFESDSFLSRLFKASQLHLDIVDYPGEWLLDLTLLDKDYEDWSAEALNLATQTNRADLATDLNGFLASIDGSPEEEEALTQKGAKIFTDYLKACRADERALSMLPPGRFLMPGDMEGSPALTFLPLPVETRETAEAFYQLNAKRYEAYKTHIIRPFFKSHFSKIDRQIVLVDVLSVLNAGPQATRDLETTLGEVLSAFNPGRNTWLSGLMGRRLDKIVFAATKADHLHHADHDRLEAILEHLLGAARHKASSAGAAIDTLALASIRATREAYLEIDGDTAPAVLGTPLNGEKIGKTRYDGTSEIALFPGDLPDTPEDIYDPVTQEELGTNPLSYLRFQPPALEQTAEGVDLSLPHIRLDRALQFLLGDKLS